MFCDLNTTECPVAENARDLCTNAWVIVWRSFGAAVPELPEQTAEIRTEKVKAIAYAETLTGRDMEGEMFT
jgi:hypothetical protein